MCEKNQKSREHEKTPRFRGFLMVGEDRFELSKSMTTDLQSVPFGRSGTLPNMELMKGFEPSTY